MRFKHHMELEKGQLDIAPLIDVVFLLLIFFMLTSNFIAQQGIKVNLPNAVSSKTLPSENFIIFVTDKNLVIINGKKINPAALNTKIKRAAQDKSRIMIKADEEASLGRVVEIWDLCREAGITNVNIATALKE